MTRANHERHNRHRVAPLLWPTKLSNSNNCATNAKLIEIDSNARSVRNDGESEIGGMPALFFSQLHEIANKINKHVHKLKAKFQHMCIGECDNAHSYGVAVIIANAN